MVYVATSSATTHDSKLVQAIHADLAASALLPGEHLVDQGYLDTELLLTSQAQHGVELIGPVPADQSWQAAAAQGFAVTDFQVDWDGQAVRCPQGQASTSWRPATDQYGDPVVHVNFARGACAVCLARIQCTRSATTGRKLTLRPRTKHEALVAARQRQQTADFQARYALRAGIEGSLAQGTRVFGLRQARYRRFPKTIATECPNCSQRTNWRHGAGHGPDASVVRPDLSLPLIGITTQQRVGRVCRVWLVPGIERAIPVAATSLAGITVAPPVGRLSSPGSRRCWRC